MILYLHGFRSAPASSKAMALRQHMTQKGLDAFFWCEQLPFAPQEAIALIEQQIEHQQREHPDASLTLVGSSLGGYYATWLAEKHGIKAAVINPAVKAFASLEQWLGPQSNLYTGETFNITRRHIDDLLTFSVPVIRHPDLFWLLAESGDEVLDYRDAVRLYTDCHQTVLEGGNHSFTRWQDYLDEILVFAGLRAPVNGAATSRTPSI